MSSQNIDATKGSVWKQQLKERKQHHMQSYLKVVLLKLKTQDDSHATSNMSTQNLEDVPFTNATVPLSYIFAALLMMVGLGTLIGFIPAEKAISTKPIDALRDE